MSHQVVASDDDVFLPPEDSSCDDEILFLSLVPEESPFAGRDAIVSKAGTTRHSQELWPVVHGRVLKIQKRKI